MTLIGNLVQDAKIIERADREPMVALKIATSDPMGREAREAGRGKINRPLLKALANRLTDGCESTIEPTASYHDVLSFGAGINKYLVDYKKGSVQSISLALLSFEPNPNSMNLTDNELLLFRTDR